MKFFVPLIIAICTGLNVWGNEADINIDLNGNWVFEKAYGKVEKSKYEFDANSLVIDYVFEETSVDSHESPDYKGRDAFYLLKSGKWNLSHFTFGEFEYTGNETPFSFAILIRDMNGRQVEYKQFPWNDPSRRTYRFAMNAPASGVWSEIDLKNITQIGIYIDEAGEFRYQPNHGHVKIHSLKFSNFDRISNMGQDISLIERLRQDSQDVAVLKNSLAERKTNITDLEVQIAAAKYNTIFNKNQKVVLFSQSIWNKSRRGFKYFNIGAKQLVSLVFKSAGNEYQSDQFIVVPPRAGVERVSVSLAGGFRNQSGDIIAAENIEIKIPAFVNTTPSSLSYYDYVGETAEIMMPNHQFSVPGGSVQPVWVTVKVPENAVPGKYQGGLIVSAAGKNINIPMELTVYDFSLPATRSMSRQFIYWLPAIANWYGFRNGDYPCDYNADGYDIPEEMVFAHLDFLLKYPIDIINIGWVFDSKTGEPTWPLIVNKDGTFDYSRFDRLMEFCRERGMRGFSMGDFGRKAGLIQDKEYQSKVRRIMVPFIAHLKEKKWFVDGTWKILDEPDNQELYIESVEESKFIRSLDPKIKILSAVAIPDEALMEFVDIWLLRPHVWNDQIAKKVRGFGSEASWYWCVVPYARPLPNYFINYPATDPRVIEWMHYKVGAKHFLMWALNNWSNNIKLRDELRWPAIPWNPNTYANFNGEGVFIYPLPGGKLVSSMRLDLLREGAEEYEYFIMLESFLKKLEKKGIGSDIVADGKALLKLDIMPSIYAFDANSQKMDAIREQAAELIVKAKKILN